MPYIRDKDRLEATSIILNSGQLNFRITRLIIEYMKQKGECYQTINDIIGALEGAKLEFYARIVRPYEDQKIKENGDVY